MLRINNEFGRTKNNTQWMSQYSMVQAQLSIAGFIVLFPELCGMKGTPEPKISRHLLC